MNCKPTEYSIQVVSGTCIVPLYATKPYDITAIIRAVTVGLGVYRSQLTGKCRKSAFVDARYILYRIVRDNHPTTSYDTIGKFFKRDHSHVINSLKRFNDLMFSDPAFRAKYNLVLSRLKGHQYDNE
jgi:chromosomal replication initiation ATPase DnaA